MNRNYNESLKFWNQAFVLDEKTKEEYVSQINPDEDWKELADSEKLRDIIIEKLSKQSKVLDYGCGEGWAGITLNKAGCKDVTCVDVVENAITLTKFFQDAFQITEGFKAECVSTDWIEKVPDGVYDGVFCSNVIDVVPAEVAENIIKNLARITSNHAKIVIGMNYYAEPISNPEKNIEVKDGNQLYIDGILRMVTRTDDEWKHIFEKYFKVETIDYFAWPGETEEKRRIFGLVK